MLGVPWDFSLLLQKVSVKVRCYDCFAVFRFLNALDCCAQPEGDQRADPDGGGGGKGTVGQGLHQRQQQDGEEDQDICRREESQRCGHTAAAAARDVGGAGES